MSDAAETTLPPLDAEVTLREVTRDTVRAITRLKVAPDQEQFVASNAVSIAQAYFDRDAAWFRAIYADETPVGFVMLYDKPEEAEYFLWRFMVDQRYQGRGYGWKALERLVEHVRTRPNATTLGVSYVPGEGSPGPFYHKFGFVDTGEVDDDELVARLDLA
jgi:diamine N-acetyltransferase